MIKKRSKTTIKRFVFLSMGRIRSILFYNYRLKNCGDNVTIMKPLFFTPQYISCGSNVLLLSGSRIEGIENSSAFISNPHLIIGDGTSFQQNCHLTFAGELKIGKEVTISFNVSIQDTDHNYTSLEINVLNQALIYKKTEIGDYCFIGSGAKIQAGTVLGKQCVVGTNAVVRGHFPDYCVIVGVPGRVVKRYNLETKKWEKTDKDGNFIK